MALQDFDKIVDIVENNIKNDWASTRENLTQSLGMTIDEIGETFKLISGNTLGMYFKERKAYNTMNDIFLGSEKMSIDSYVEDYGYTDYSVFYRQIRKLIGKGPEEVKKETSFAIPRVKHLNDYMDMKLPKCKAGKIVYAETSMKERLSLIDSIYRKREEISKLEKELREHGDNQFCELQMLIQMNKNELNIWEEQLNHIDYKDIHIENLTTTLYKEFLKIEEYRIIFGFDIDTIVKLYNESIEKKIDFEILCDNQADELLGQDESIEYEDWEEQFYQRQDYEMNLAEAYHTYYGDDEEIGYDPFDTSWEEEHHSEY